MGHRVLVVAEGEHELNTGTTEGSLVVLLRRMFASAGVLNFETRRIREFKARLHGKGNTLTKKFLSILREAEQNQFSAVCILIDRDHDQNRVSSAQEAQQTNWTSLPRAIGIAVETYDAWFLADHASLSYVLKHPISKQPEPEREVSPKQRLELLRDEAPTMGQSENSILSWHTSSISTFLKKDAPQVSDHSPNVSRLSTYCYRNSEF